MRQVRIAGLNENYPKARRAANQLLQLKWFDAANGGERTNPAALVPMAPTLR
jgi:hypothetical protein